MADTPKNDDGEALEAAAPAADEVKPEQRSDAASKAVETLKDVVAKAEAAQAASASIALPTAEPKADKAPPRKLATFPRSGGAKPGSPASAEISAKITRKVNKGIAANKATPRKTAAAGPSKIAMAAADAQSGINPKTRQPGIQKSKEKIMASSADQNTQKMGDSVAELQNRSQAAYEKSSEMMSEMSGVAKGNVEAMVESGKIFSTGMQDLAKAYVEDAKSAYEQMTADLKEMAAVKSPTELLQIQGKIMRRNFDALVASTSKNAEKMMKLSNESFAPISARVNVATEKMSKAD